MKQPKKKKFLLAVLLLAVGCTAMTILISYAGGLLVNSPLEVADNAILDLAILLRDQTQQDGALTTQDIAIVDIDDASIEKLGRVNLWPRAYDAAVTEYITSGKPKAIGFDILYTEHDTLSPVYEELLKARGYEHANDILHTLSTDDSLAHVFARAGNIYLSVFDDDEAVHPPNPDLLSLFPSITAPRQWTRRYNKLIYPVLPVESLRQVAKGIGTINMSTTDGIVRKYIMVQVLPFRTSNDSSSVPIAVNFPVLMAMNALGLPPSSLHIEKNAIHLGDQRTIAVNDKGEFRLNWLGSREHFRYISYYKVLQGKVPKEVFENKFVFIGTSAAGLSDLKTTPNGRLNGKVPGVEVHALALYNLLNNSYLRERSLADVWPWLLLFAVVLQLVFMRLQPVYSFIAMAGTFLGEAALYLFIIFPALQTAAPVSCFLLLTLLTFITGLIYNYRSEGRERALLKRAFERYVPPDVVHQILENTDTLSLGGQKKLLTVLFSDIRGFTTYSEQRDPEEIVSFLNYYLRSMSHVIFRHKGTIDKFIGDAIMAVFGAPVDLPDHARRACATALDMVRELEQINAQQRVLGQESVAIGVGINTGDMTAGNIGSDMRFDYTVIGDAVNLGSRLEQLNKQFGTIILVSESTMQHCGEGVFLFREIAAVAVKGKEQPVKVYELVDDVHNSEQHHAFLSLYNSAIEQYRQKEFVDAHELFTQCLSLRPSDGPTLYYLAQCRNYRLHPEEFTDILIMHSK